MTNMRDNFQSQMNELLGRINAPGGLPGETRAAPEQVESLAETPTAAGEATQIAPVGETTGASAGVASEGAGAPNDGTGAPAQESPGTTAPPTETPASEERWTPPSEPGAWRSLQSTLR